MIWHDYHYYLNMNEAVDSNEYARYLLGAAEVRDALYVSSTEAVIAELFDKDINQNKIMQDKKMIYGSKIGDGYFGKVYRQRKKNRSNQHMALKIINLKKEEGKEEEFTVADFINEVAILSMVKGCSAAVKMHDYWINKTKTSITGYIRMEYLSGDTLQKDTGVTRGDEARTLELVINVADQSNDLLDILLANGLINFDMKADNFMKRKPLEYVMIDMGLVMSAKNEDGQIQFDHTGTPFTRSSWMIPLYEEKILLPAR